MAVVREGKAGRERTPRLRKVKDLIKEKDQQRREERRGGAKEERWACITELS